MKECPKCKLCYEDNLNNCPVDESYLFPSVIHTKIINGRYILVSRLGKGGMGIVFKAKHKFLKSSHAIKVILPSLVEEDKTILVRFHQEALLAASIDHPNVIRVTDFGVDDETMPFLAMEYIDGTSLSFYLVEDKPLPFEKAYELFHPVALGVAEAHRKGIVHRDLKPQNIMVQKGLPLAKAIKVLDFGLAKIKSMESFGSFVQAKTMSILGSPPYMPPEQWSDGDLDHRGDIYALGVMFYQMLTGKLPFRGDSIPAIMFQHMSDPPPDFSTLGVSLSPKIEAVVKKALEKERENRQNSVDEMLEELNEAIAKPTSSVFFPGEATEYMPNTFGIVKNDPKLNIDPDATNQLTDSQRERLHSYFDSSVQSNLTADPNLAQEFLQAQARVEQAKAKASEADKLVQEFVEAQKVAEDAQNKAIEAKQKIEDDVRQRVEAEMEKLAAEQQAKQEAEAERLAKESEARSKAEERAIYLAQTALEAQQIAEQERKKRQKESQQRELEEGVRMRAEEAVVQLSQQVADAKKQFEEAKKQAEYESELRQIADAKRKKIEEELQSVAQNESQRRRLTEAEAQRQIQEQAVRFEQEALAAQQKVEDSRWLAELEVQKREQAEAARRYAEEEAMRLGQEILKVQKQMEELKQHVTFDAITQDKPLNWSDVSSSQSPVHSGQFPPSGNFPLGNSQGISGNQAMPPQIHQSGYSILQSPVISGTHHPSNVNLSGFIDTNQMPARNISVPLLILSVGALLLVLTASSFGIYFFVIKDTGNANISNIKKNDNSVVKSGNNSAPSKREMVPIQGGSFQMGRDIPKSDINDEIWGNQYPVHTINVAPFLIGKTETTNEEYAEFIKETGHSAPTNWENGNLPEGQEKFPVTFVSLADAKAFAAWASKGENKTCRLPTEEEWEFAARNGSEQTDFPWGNELQNDSANVASGKLKEVGIMADETKIGGIKDMLGNVVEWTSTKYGLYLGHPGKLLPLNGEHNVGRGSSWQASQKQLKNTQWLLTIRHPIPIDEKYSYLGFRIVCQP